MGSDKEFRLVCMPWGGFRLPSPAASLLKAELTAGGIPCRIDYFGLDWVAGLEHYLEQSGYAPDYLEELQIFFCNKGMLNGDWLFAHAMYDQPDAAVDAFIASWQTMGYQLNKITATSVKALKPQAALFIRQCAEQLAEASVLGFSIATNQRMAALFAAAEVKKINPMVKIVFGGAEFIDHQYAHALLQHFPPVDAVFVGEGDRAIVNLADVLLTDGTPDRIPGLVWRDGSGRLADNGPAQRLTDLDQLPIPDFSDFTRRCRELWNTEIPFLKPLEMSRGCLWGEHCQCIFCNAPSRWRTKSATRIVTELQTLERQYPPENVRIPDISFCDEMTGPEHFSKIFPALLEAGVKLNAAIQNRAELSLDNLQMLKKVGFNTIFCGIESLDANLLKLLRKGTHPLACINTLKFAAQSEVMVLWCFLYGVPGEKRVYYRRLAQTLAALTHLNPPRSTISLRLLRKSPMFESPLLTGIQALPLYRFIYPHFSDEIRRELAWIFDFKFADRHRADDYARPALKIIADWKKHAGKGQLVYCDGLIIDTRFNRIRKQHRLNRLDQDIYAACMDRHRNTAQIRTELCAAGFQPVPTQRDIVKKLNGFVRNRLMVKDGKSYLAVALRCPAGMTAAAYIEKQRRAADITDASLNLI